MDFLTNFKDLQKEAFGIEPMDFCRMTSTEYQDYMKGYDKSKRSKKQRILERLLDSLVSRARFVGSESQRSIKKMFRTYTAIKMILVTGVFIKYAIFLSERTLKESLHFGSTEIAIDLSRIIFIHYNYNSEYEKARKYHDLCMDLLEKQELEIKAEWYLSDLASSNRLINNDKLKLKSTRYLSDLIQVVPDTIRYKKALYLLMCYTYGMEGNYTKMADVATNAMQYFKNLHYRHEVVEMIFKKYLIEALLRLNKIDKAESLISDSPITDLTTFKQAEILFRILMRKNNFAKAREIFNRLDESKIKRQIEYTQQRLKLYRFYLGIINKDTEIRHLKFDLKAVENIKDKNIRHHIVISQILLNALHGDNEYISNNNQLLKKIAQHRINSKRAKIFIRMLLLIPSKVYQPDIFKRKTDLLLEKLKNEPIELEDLEILSFENIWESLSKRNSSFLRLDLTG